MKHTRRRGRSLKKNMKTRKQKAGAYLGQGAFGVVFAEPRIPCENENVGDLPDNEVSKIFLRRALNSAQDEANLRRRLVDGGWSESEIEKLKKYAIIPSRLCQVKNTPEENGTMWNKMEPYTSREWRTNEHTGDFMGGIDLDNLPSKYPYMIISERGGNDLSEEFIKVNTEEQFYKAIIRLNDIVKGVQMLLKKGFVHPDLKSQNSIVAGDRYKMIDLADVKDVTLCHDYSILSGAFMYMTWPSTNVFFDLLNGCRKGSELSSMDINKVKRNINIIRPNNVFDIDRFYEYIHDKYDIFKKFNEQNYFFMDQLTSAFFFKPSDGFLSQEIKEIQMLQEVYFNERTFGLVHPISRDTINEFTQKMKDDETPKSEQFQKLSKKMTEYFIGLAETNPENFSRELFTRLELHSIGMMMIELLYNFKFNIRIRLGKTQVNILKNDPTLRKNIMRLHRIAGQFYLQNNVITNDPDRMEFSQKNVEELVNLYGQFVNIVKELVDTSSDSSDSSDSSEDDEDETSEAPSSLPLTGEETTSTSESGEDD